ncbi:adenylate/guanylate cyclase domain-containing protein [Aeromicrobium sp. Leaf350]|uniref:adenylate/guanylate cyclase domain-containing protein n=1 Tax=Aeromicrobium sp. Leaf350 TaxID=2876565 RepID=UPI001E2F72CE|nr:adenylate/guanylate cyclase domain-containing protein [Aeromicrobium sp. Leaf350]
MTDPQDDPGAGTDSGARAHAFDPAILIEVAGSYLLGDDGPALTRHEVAERSGVPLEQAQQMWRSLGFAETGDDEAAFTAADVAALEDVQELVELRVLDPEVLPALVRTMGSTFSRMADWQTRLLLATLVDAPDDELPLELLTEIVPVVERLQSYIWRRHLVSAASRLMLSGSTDSRSTPLAVGFVDIVGYTAQSRRLSTTELAAMVETFERITSELVVEAGGQVVKTIGDEVLYTLGDPFAAAELALALVDRGADDVEGEGSADGYPQVRVGTAYGTVLSRLGDVYGPVVNIAARLTSVSRPGRALIDAELAALVRDDDRFRVRRAPRASVKGYEHLELWSLKHPKPRR